ncbi:SubName: Full=Uncharacterized protein {ECO:0000313/EMBL:CCA67957.1} [Serendipita indica DSM 11827]|nr:SubName: Full=Uncharacterized protein {ECO:0000313/EMBL:CCA67957.1} [Serendipita indica DSM 11827]
MTSTEHHHNGVPMNQPFPDDSTESSVSRALSSFPATTPDAANIGRALRPHNGHEENMKSNAEWLSQILQRHPPDRAQTLGAAIMGILRSHWWNQNVSRPPDYQGDEFDHLVEGPGYDKCALCGSYDGISCVKLHFDYSH